MQIKSARIKSYRSWRIDERVFSETAKNRREKLDLFNKLRKEGCTEETALEVIKVSRATYFRWRSAYSKHGLSGLEPERTVPINKRTPQWSRQIEQQVLHLRKQFPLWGKKTLAAILRRDRNLEISESTVGRILNKLIKLDKIRPVAFYYGRVKVKKPRVFNHHAKRWQRGMCAKNPGELIQIDHMTINLYGGTNLKHFEAICPITKITVAQTYNAASSKSAADFLEFVRLKMPFKIKSIQVDGGSEFRDKFENLCQQQNIPLFVLPPKSPELNGNVERVNKTLRYEFYRLYDGLLDFFSIRKSLKDYLKIYNEYRPHQNLNLLTPMAYWQTYSNGGL